MFTCKRCDKDASKESLFHIGDYEILTCKKCNHRFANISADVQHVDNIYNDTYFEGGDNAGYSDYYAEKDLLIKRGEKYADILDKYITKGTILDVGAAAGFLLKGFQNQGWEGVGIEPNKTMAKYAQEKLQASPIEHFKSEK